MVSWPQELFRRRVPDEIIPEKYRRSASGTAVAVGKEIPDIGTKPRHPRVPLIEPPGIRNRHTQLGQLSGGLCVIADPTKDGSHGQ
jgi:hypothetical protein